MKTSIKKKQEGFTIIEVLIVLAIAGLILLIVFLAVPALQRNSRNTQRRTDVSKMTAILQEAANNNNGKLPVSTTRPDVIANENYAQYDVADINYNILASGTALPASVAANQVFIRNNLKCSGNNTNTGNGTVSTTAPAAVTTTTGATLRNVIALYAVEQQGSTVQIQCLES